LVGDNDEDSDRNVNEGDEFFQKDTKIDKPYAKDLESILLENYGDEEDKEKKDRDGSERE
jgi:hypothetical protein